MLNPLVPLTFFALVLGTDASPAAQAKKDLPGDKLSAAQRHAIGNRMVHHAAELTDLLKAVLILDHDAVQERARAIAEAPKLSRPPTGETDTLNAGVPARFYELQDVLVSRAIALSEAARRRDDVQMGKAFGQLTESCVACHSVYLWRPAPEK